MTATLVDWLNELATERTCCEIGNAIYLLIFLRQDAFHRRNPVTNAWIGAQTGFNPRTIENYIRRLKAAGWIRVESGWNGKHIRLRTRFAPGPVQETDFEEIRTYGWQRTPKVPSDDMDSEAFGRKRDRGESGAMHVTNSFADSDPAFLIEESGGGRRGEFLHDSDPPFERANAATAG